MLILNKNGNVLHKNGDSTNKKCVLTNKNGVLTNKNGVLTNKNGDFNDLCKRMISWGIFFTYPSGKHAWFGNPHHGGFTGKPCEKLPEGSSRWPFSKTRSWLSKLGEYYDKYIWVNYSDLTATSLRSWLVLEIIPKWP